MSQKPQKRPKITHHQEEEPVAALLPVHGAPQVAAPQVEQPGAAEQPVAAPQVEQQVEQLPDNGASMEDGYISDLEVDASQPYPYDGEVHPDPVSRPMDTGKGIGVQTRGPSAGAGVGGPGHDDAASVSGASTNSTFSQKSQASIHSIADSVDGLPLPDGGLMLTELADGVVTLTAIGMEHFHNAVDTAGGYGPVASIAFISLLSANNRLFPNIDLPNINGEPSLCFNT